MEKKDVFAGWAERDITPDKKVNLGGQFHQRISEYVKDPVTTTALAIGTEEDYAVMVSCDTVSIPQDIREECRRRVGKKIPEIDVKKVLFNATHTHTAPDVRPGVYPPVPEGAMSASEYKDLFISRVAEVVDEAWRRRKKGSVSWAYGHAVVGHNRRAAYEPTIRKKQAG